MAKTRKKSMARKKAPATAPKDPGIAALISVVGMLILGAPALGYFYLGNVRKGIIYLLAPWIATVALLVLATVGAVLTFGLGLICIVPLALVLIAFDLLIVWDVYLVAQGEKPKLPEF